MRKNSPWIVLAMALLLCLAACQTPAGRSVGQVVDDAAITTEVKAKLLNDSVTRGFGVSVETFQGQVTLTGAVDTPQQRERAGEIAAGVKGVKKVNNLVGLKK